MSEQDNFRRLFMARLRTRYVSPFFDNEDSIPWFFPITRDGFSILMVWDARIYINTPSTYWVETQRSVRLS